MSTITLGGHTADLVQAGYMARLALSDLLSECQDFHTRAAVGAAALRICWPEDVAWPGTRRPVTWTIRTHILDYGAECYESLGGLPEADLFPALFDGLTFALGASMSEEAVRSAEGFSGAPEGG